MSLLDLPIPPRPDTFSPFGAVAGVAIDFDAYEVGPGWPGWEGRPKITPRVGVIHTNAASREGSLESQTNWANTPTASGMLWNTHPHYAFNHPQPTKLLPSNRRGIGNATRSDTEIENTVDPLGRKDASFFSLVIESADAGTIAGLGEFLYDHAELIAQTMAYETIVAEQLGGSMPLDVPDVWFGEGWATHTWPFDADSGAYTIRAGKTCPGGAKKQQFRADLLPRARQICEAWTTPEEPDMDPFYFTTREPPAPLWVSTDGITATRVTASQWDALGNPPPTQIGPAEARLFAYVPSLEHDVIGL